jgi:hypothetical protein
MCSSTGVCTGINGKKVLGEESNLLYVAVTRAKKSLLLTESLLALLRSRGVCYVYTYCSLLGETSNNDTYSRHRVCVLCVGTLYQASPHRMHCSCQHFCCTYNNKCCTAVQTCAHSGMYDTAITRVELELEIGVRVKIRVGYEG